MRRTFSYEIGINSIYIYFYHRTLKTEPLTSVGQLEKYLLKMVAKQWYDYDRTTLAFVRKIQSVSAAPVNNPLTFRHGRDFDENGIIYWIGTNGKTVPDWVNPAQVIVFLLCLTKSTGLIGSINF